MKKDLNYGEIMLRHFYRKYDERKFFLKSSDREYDEFSLLYKVMSDVFFQYYDAWDIDPPSKSKNYPRLRNQPKPLKYPNKEHMTGLELHEFQKKSK